MSSNPFKQALANLKATKNLDTFMVGNASSALGEGTHDVTITAVGPAVDRQGNVTEGQVAVTYTSDEGKSYTDRVYLSNADGTELSFGVRQLVSGVLKAKERIGQWIDNADDEKAFEMFTGMKCRVTLGYGGPGFQVRSTGTGEFAAFDLDKRGNVGEKLTANYADIASARSEAEALGHKRAYLRVRGIECTHEESNAAAFATALAGKNKGKPAVKVTKAV